MHLTGDFHAVGAANNWLAVRIDSSLLLDNPLDIDPDTITLRRVVNMNDRALRNIQVFEDEDLCGHVRAKEGEFRGMLEELRDIPIVGDVRGAGFFHALELVKDRDTKESFDDEESEWLLRDFLSGELYKNGLICRADDRGDPVIQLAPPLVCDTEQFEEIVGVLRPILEEASQIIEGRS